MKILYGCCFTADLNNENITYVDIIPGIKKNKGIYLCEDIRNIDFNNYDIIICTPPCNYYSRANYRRNTSKYSIITKELLPYCINKAYNTGKPFLIENVRNSNLMYKLDIPSDIFIYEIGRHTYFTNVLINFNGLNQIEDNIQNKAKNNRQGGQNVNNIIKYFIEYITQ